MNVPPITFFFIPLFLPFSLFRNGQHVRTQNVGRRCWVGWMVKSKKKRLTKGGDFE